MTYCVSLGFQPEELREKMVEHGIDTQVRKSILGMLEDTQGKSDAVRYLEKTGVVSTQTLRAACTCCDYADVLVFLN